MQLLQDQLLRFLHLADLLGVHLERVPVPARVELERVLPSSGARGDIGSGPQWGPTQRRVMARPSAQGANGQLTAKRTFSSESRIRRRGQAVVVEALEARRLQKRDLDGVRMPRDAKRHRKRVAASMSKLCHQAKPPVPSSKACHQAKQEASSFCRYEGGGDPLRTRTAAQLGHRLHGVGHNAQQWLQLYHIQILGRHL